LQAKKEQFSNCRFVWFPRFSRIKFPQITCASVCVV